MNLFSIVTFLLFQSTSILCIGSNTFTFFPSLPFGEYNLIMKQIKNCDLSQENKIQNNFYLSHNPKSNATEIKGNITLKIPMDDTFFLEANFAFKAADGSWKENTFIQKSPKACSSFRSLMGAAYTTVMSGLGMNATCPVLPGVYTSPGLDTSFFSKTNMPKTFIYGTYKIRFFFSRLNEVYGCNIYVVEFKRP